MSDIPSKHTSSDDAVNDAYHYDHYLGPLFFEPYAIEVAKRIDPSGVATALEIAAGTGRVTRHLRRSIAPTATLIASDISSAMLEEAKKRSHQAAIDWQIIDAQEIPFEDNSIDLLVCCFGYMFVPDKEKAFAEAYRVLKPGGQLLFTTWDKLEHNAISYVSRTVIDKYLESPLPESYNLAVSMSDEDQIRPLLENAGFSKMSIERNAQSSVCSTAKEAANSLVEAGFIFKEIIKADPGLKEEIKCRLEKELSEKFGAAPMVAPLSAFICQAWK